MLVLYVSLTSLVDPARELVFIEMFAGTGRLTRLARSLGYAAEGHDFVYDKEWQETGGNNCMDITKDAGYVFLVMDY